jgi:hypothetical protein
MLDIVVQCWTLSYNVGHGRTMLDIVVRCWTLSNNVGHGRTMLDIVEQCWTLSNNVGHGRTILDIVVRQRSFIRRVNGPFGRGAGRERDCCARRQRLRAPSKPHDTTRVKPQIPKSVKPQISKSESRRCGQSRSEEDVLANQPVRASKPRPLRW